ncbi:breast cancer type 1 susceptibility protein [Discoglossus pictus]
MSSSALDVEEIQNVLSVMQKNLECPICLELMKEPVATKCDHIFCRFCMLQLLSKKKKNRAQCPMCKCEVTKRSLQESPRFKLLTEGLLKIINAFELDSGYKFFPSQDYAKTIEEQMGKEEQPMVQCTGYRNRKKRTLSGDEHLALLQETSAHTDLPGRRCSSRNKRLKQETKQVLIKCVSDSSEGDLFKKAGSLGSLGDGRSRESGEGLEKVERSGHNENGSPNEMASLKPDAEEMVASDLAECGFSERDLESTRSNLLIIDGLRAMAETSTGNRETETNGDYLTKKIKDSVLKKTNKRSNPSVRLEKKISNVSSRSKSPTVNERETLKLDIDCQYDKEVSLVEENPTPPDSGGDLSCAVSKKRMKRSIQRVNEWLSKNKDQLKSSTRDDDSLSDVFPFGDEDVSDKSSCTSDETEIMPSPNVQLEESKLEMIASKPTVSAEDKVFGKIYKRERKSNPNIFVNLVTDGHPDDVTKTIKENETPKRNNLKQKRKTTKSLQPEDFIKKINPTEVDKCVNGTVSAVPDADGDQVGITNTCSESVDFFPLELGNSGKICNDEDKPGDKIFETESNAHSPNAKNETNSRQKRKPDKKQSTRSTRSLTLVRGVELDTGASKLTQVQIDSYPSSEEPRKEIRPRRSKRLQSLPEDLVKENSTNITIHKTNDDMYTNHDGIQKMVNKELEGSHKSSDPSNKISFQLKAEDKCLIPFMESEDCDTQISMSLFLQDQAANNLQASMIQVDGEQNLLKTKDEITIPENISHNNHEDHWKPAPTIMEDALPEDMEMEDSELDTEYLLKTFKGAKRSSFLLEPSTVTDSDKENYDPKCLQLQSGTHDVLDQSGHQDVMLNKVNERENDGNSNLDSTGSFVGATDQHMTVKEVNGQTVLLSHDHGDLLTQTRIAKNRRNLRSKKKISLFPENIVENLPMNTKSQGLNSSLENASQTNVVNTINETESSEGCNKGENAAVSKSEGLLVYSETESMLPSLVVTHQSPSAVSRRDTESETSHGENEQAKSDCYKSCRFDEDQVNQITFTNVSQGSVAKKVLGHPVSPTANVEKSPVVYSATPDKFCYFARPEENTSFGEVANKSVVFGDMKTSRDYESSASPNLSSQTVFKRRKRRAQKLDSSEEESSEDDDLPCFQALLFGKSSNKCLGGTVQKNSSNASSPRQQGGVLAMFSSSSVSGKTQPSGTLPKDAFPTLSQGSECSVNLFSSQSNTSELSVNGVNNQKEGKIRSKSRENSQKRTTEQHCANDQERMDTDEKDQEGQLSDHNLAEVSGCESEVSHTGDSSGLSSQGEILSTQQRDAMQNNLKKLQQEMAALEAVLEQHGTQGFRSKGECASPADDVTIRQQEAAEKQTDHDSALLSNLITEAKEQNVLERSCPTAQRGPDSDLQCGNRSVSPTPPPPLSQTNQRTETPEKVRLSISFLKELKECVLTQDEGSKVEEPPEAAPCSVVPDAKPSAKVNQTSTPVRQSPRNNRRSQRGATERPNSKGGVSCPSTAETPHLPRQTDKPSGSAWRAPSPTFTSPARSRAAGSGIKSPRVSTRKNISMVASGLNPSELTLVQKFAKKTQSVLTQQITDSSTHVIMKTDADLVCERTLKYFLGIAGRKWVVSYQWIVQSFKEGRILDEYDFEVKGDVINGRSHRGPRRSRLGSDGLLLKDFEICCYGSFSDLTPDNLEWMVTLCGATVVKDPQLFIPNPNSTPLVIVQPDARPDKTGYAALKKKFRAKVVAREWVLDSVSCYKLQPFDGYLL